jgi:YHS domain-containing protein
MLRPLIILILFPFVIHALSRFFGGILEGMRGSATTSRAPARGVQMVRDPVCGTFIVADRAVSISEGRQQVYFCSDRCRDKYRAKTA